MNRPLEILAARRRLGRRRLQPVRVGLGFVAVIVAINVLLRVLGTVTGGTPGGPRSSSYATAPAGVHGARSVRADGFSLETGGATWRAHGFVFTQPLGRDGGVVYLLPDASPLQNRLLGTADNAAFGLALAGPSTRPVEFLESYHGYGQSAGLSALPF